MRQIPQRTCTGCMQKKNKNELIRIVKNKNGKKTVELLFSPQENMIISVGKGNTFKLMKNKPIVKKIVKI